MHEVEDIRMLQRIFDGYIYSVLKYGFGKRNLLVIIKDMDIDKLLEVKKYIIKLRKQKNVLILSYDDLHKKNLSIDYLNIQLTSVVVYGSDIFKEFTVDTPRIKRHISYEANRLVITLKNELLSRRWSWQIKSLLFSVVPRILPLIVAHLYVKGEKIPNGIPDTINRYLKYNDDATVLLKIRRNVTSAEAIVLMKEVFVFLENISTRV